VNDVHSGGNDAHGSANNTSNHASNRQSTQSALAQNGGTETAQDSLVLVGSLYSLPRNYIEFEHETQHVTNNSRQAVTKPEETTKVNSNGVNNHIGSNGNNSVSNNTHIHIINKHNINSRTSSSMNTFSETFNVVRTLEPQECPLAVRDRMLEYIQDQLRQRIREYASSSTKPAATLTPNLQWFFVPQTGINWSIPNCIELDGYATSLEDDESDYEEDEDDLDDMSDEAEYKLQRQSLDKMSIPQWTSQQFPWTSTNPSSKAERSSSSMLAMNGEATSSHLPVDPVAREALLDRYHLEYDRRQQLSQNMAVLPGCTISGYLLKRSRHDRHVWRKVHCVLTIDHLWYVSRLYSFPYDRVTENGGSNSDNGSSRKSPLRFARHGRIRLTRALLLEPNAEYAPLFRTPYSFEVVATDGTSHVFRARNKQLQTRWIQTISDRIVESFENSLLRQSELILADEALAMSRRRSTLSVQSLWKVTNAASQTLSSTSHASVASTANSHADDRHHVAVNGILGEVSAMVLRWGLKVADYRETCRYIQGILPAKAPVFAVTPRQPTPSHDRKQLQQQHHDHQHTNTQSHSSQSTDRHTSNNNNNNTVQEPLDPYLQQLIKSAWVDATDLLHEAIEQWSFYQEKYQHAKEEMHRKSMRGVETLCRHIDYVITGKHSWEGLLGTQHEHDTKQSSNANHQHQRDPPPITLFDGLLAELQKWAVTTDGCKQGLRTIVEDMTSNGHDKDAVIDDRNETKC
jgi:PH domain